MPAPSSGRLYPVLFCTLSAICGCGDSSSTQAGRALETPTTSRAGSREGSSNSGTPVKRAESASSEGASGGLNAKIKIKRGDGSTAFSLKPQSDGAKLVDESEKEVARFNASTNKLKIKDPSDKVLAYVVVADSRFKVEDANQEQELFQVQRQDDGDWKLEDGQDSLIYKIKRRDYGFEIEDSQEASLYKIKVKGQKTSLRNSADETVLYTNDPVAPIAFASLGLDAIDDVAIRAALFVALQTHPEE